MSVPEEVHEGDRTLDELQSDVFYIHLPKLERAGYVEWDRETHEVVKGPNFEEIRPLIELLEARADELPDGWL